MESMINPPTFSDYFYILLRWKKYILLSVLLVGIITTGIVFIISPTYKANAVLMIPPENPFSLGSILSGKAGGGSLSAKLLGISTSSEDVLLGILNSRKALKSTIDKFSLMSYYGIKDGNYDKALKAFAGDVTFEMNEHAMLEIAVVNKNPVISAAIVNHFVHLLDSLNIKYNIEFAANNRKYIEQRYEKCFRDLSLTEELLREFQKKNGVFSVPQQFEAAIKAAGELEAQLQIKETNLDLARIEFGENAPQTKLFLQERDLIKKKILELKNSDTISRGSNIFFNFKNAPDLMIEYMRLYRDFEIQQKIMEVVLPLYEQAKAEENKYLPTVSVLDEAKVPELKNSPKRGIIILAFTFMALFVSAASAFRGEKSLHMKEFKNPVLEREHRFYSFIARILKIYKLK